MSHVCGDQCDRLLLRAAHERSRLSARRKRLAKIRGHRPKVRWLGGHEPSKQWIDRMWDVVWDR